MNCFVFFCLYFSSRSRLRKSHELCPSSALCIPTFSRRTQSSDAQIYALKHKLAVLSQG